MARSNLAVRVATAAIAVPLLLVLLLWRDPVAPWVWFGVTLLVACGGALEVLNMTHRRATEARVVGVLMTAAVHAGIYVGHDDPRWLLSLLFLTPIVGLLAQLRSAEDIPSAALRQTAAVTAPLYVGGLLASLALLRRDAGDHGGHYVILVLTMAWFADTGGYFVGKRFGRRKLAPIVSPNKTWEGFFGALLGGAIAATVASLVYLPGLSLFPAIVLGAIAAAVGQLGDLVESLLKRSTGVKDSGNLVPGHGGLLDRVDAVLFIAPVVYLFWVWFQAPAA
jgi:phosphatidate cytidylyltransferase